jgi:hypothetical protein
LRSNAAFNGQRNDFFFVVVVFLLSLSLSLLHSTLHRLTLEYATQCNGMVTSIDELLAYNFISMTWQRRILFTICLVAVLVLVYLARIPHTTFHLVGGGNASVSVQKKSAKTPLENWTKQIVLPSHWENIKDGIDGLWYSQTAQFYPNSAEKTNSTFQPLLRRHVCRGPGYDQFAQSLHAYALNTSRRRPMGWGRRYQNTVPPPGTRLLALGNSHLRQVMWAWLAQIYNHIPQITIQRVRRLQDRYALRIDFVNNASLYVLTNTYVPYSENWTNALRQLTDNWTLAEFDAVIVGNVNDCSHSRLEKYRQQNNMGSSRVSCNFTKPQPQDWMKAYSGRLLFVTSFDGHKFAQDVSWGNAVQFSRQAHDRVGFIYGRCHVERTGHEGASIEQGGDVECAVCSTDSHRCIGEYGGHPDLIAWDIVEWLWTGMDSLNCSSDPCPFLKELDGGMNCFIP